MKGLTPVILLVASAGLYFFFISPQYEQLQIVQKQYEEYQRTVDTVEQVKQVRRDLEVKYNNIPPSDLERLEKILPLHVDNVRLIMEVDAIASQYGISIYDLDVDDPRLNAQVAPTRMSTVPVATRDYESVKLSFSFDASYQNFLSLMSELQQSLRVIDIRAIELAPAKAGNNLSTYTMTLETYWVKR